MFKGKNAIITGSRRGIGRATLEVLVHHGVNVWACARKADEKFEEEMRQLAFESGVWIKPIYFDTTNELQMKNAVKQIRDEKINVDILVNNAGVLYDATLFMTSMEKTRWLFENNFFAHLMLTQLVSRMMMKAGKGSIVNVASYIGIDGNRGQVTYGSSKAAIIGMTKSLSKELSEYGIRVNAVAPGVIDTDMIKVIPENEMKKLMDRCLMHRLANPIEVANAIAFLAGDDSSYITGQVLRVDGGMN